MVYLGGIAAASVFFLSDWLWGYGRGTAVAVATGMMIAIALICRSDWRYRWFRVTYVVLVLIHAAAVFLIPWSDADTPGFYVIPFAFADAFASLGIIWLVQKVVGLR